jgi:hypothetical protein
VSPGRSGIRNGLCSLLRHGNAHPEAHPITIGGAIKRKGIVRGTLDTALDMTPYVGGAKNLLEVTRGRDLFRDKRLAG